MGSGQIVHRRGPLHQTNKVHKGSKKKSSGISKSKLPRSTQISKSKKLKRERKCDNSPLIVGVLDPYTNDTNHFIAILKDWINQNANVVVKQMNDASLFINLKTRFKFVIVDTTNPNVLDLIKSLDLMLMLHRDHLIRDSRLNNDLLKLIRINCLPTTIHVLDKISSKRALKSMMDIENEKICSVENPQDFFQLFHLLDSTKKINSPFKEARAAILTDRATLIDGTLALEGFVRHRALNPNNLVHLIGYGDFQIKEIDILPDPVPIRKRPMADQSSSQVATLRPDPNKQESLSDNEFDEMEGEQTWPTAEELAAAAEKQNTKKIIRKLPPGTSDYQGAWMIEESGSTASDSDADEMVYSDEDGDSASETSYVTDHQNEVEGTEQSSAVASAEMELDDKNLSKEKEFKIYEKIREARMNELFPDEVDTPPETPARVRFARYRGLKSFRTSPWDPQENLPPDYSRIVQFQNFKQTRHRVMNETEEGANPGSYVRIKLANVPQDVSTSIIAKTMPPNVIQLLRHEAKMTIMNFLIKRVVGADLSNPVQSKEELEFHVGFRKFNARPLFTAHSLGNKFKYEKFLGDAAMVATVYAPVTFPPAPVLVFRNGELIASGSVLDSNPNRLIIKRIKLSGHPYKIYSKTAVIRFMFFNSEDVLYFKPVELVTRYNRRGHIVEPIGTHGHMKCTFDKKIRSDDCIFMNLYKRVYPKWTYTPLNHG